MKALKKTDGTLLNHWDDLVALLLESGLRTVLLYGPPDTGKSSFAHDWSAGNGLKSYRLQCTEQQPIEDLLGCSTLRKGQVVFEEGIVARAMREGAMLILDEFDLRNRAHDSVYHALLDDPRVSELRLPNGESVKPANGFRIIATTNALPKQFTPALLRRFQLKLHVDSPSRGILESLPKATAQLCPVALRGERSAGIHSGV